MPAVTTAVPLYKQPSARFLDEYEKYFMVKVMSNILRSLLGTVIKTGEGRTLSRLAGCLKAQVV
jgi:hypothetical protein